MDAHDTAQGRPAPDDRVLSPALRPLRRRAAGPDVGTRVTRLRIPFNRLTPGEDAAAVRAAIDRVVAGGWFILGPEVEAFEAEFASASGGGHAVGVGTGTDAIALTLRALGIGAGDAVIASPTSARFPA